MPALPLDEAGKYVAGAYVVFVLLLVVYIGIMAAKLSRISRELDEIAEVAERKRAASGEQQAATPAAVREPGSPVGSGGDGS
jgi:hypothetical protein